MILIVLEKKIITGQLEYTFKKIGSYLKSSWIPIVRTLVIEKLFLF